MDDRVNRPADLVFSDTPVPRREVEWDIPVPTVADLLAAFRENTVAIVAPASYPAIAELRAEADRLGITLIADCAHAPASHTREPDPWIAAMADDLHGAELSWRR